jgi:hypothetical protein
MGYRYRSHQILQIVNAPKVVREGQPLVFRKYKEVGTNLEVDLDLKDGALLNLRLSVHAGRFDEPETYRAALVLEDQRIRGVDYAHVEQKRFYKTVIPKGWHQNIIDPNLPSRDIHSNRHELLPHFEVIDLTDFLRKVAALWEIELELEDELL